MVSWQPAAAAAAGEGTQGVFEAGHTPRHPHSPVPISPHHTLQPPTHTQARARAHARPTPTKAECPPSSPCHSALARGREHRVSLPFPSDLPQRPARASKEVPPASRGCICFLFFIHDSLGSAELGTVAGLMRWEEVRVK